MIDQEGKSPSEKSSKTPPKSQETKMPYKRIQTAEGWQRSVIRRRKRDEA